MKVCFATYDIAQDLSGPSSWMQRLLPMLQMAGIELEVHVMAIGGKPGSNCAFFKKQGISVRWIPVLADMLSAIRSRLRFLEEGQPDIYVPNFCIPAYYAAGYARRSGIPTVGVLHSDDPYYRGIVDQFVDRFPDFRVSAVVPVSAFLESQVMERTATGGVIVRRIPYGVPIPTRTAELPKSTFRLVYTGRLDEGQKRISDVTHAFCAAAQNIPNLEAWIVGEGDARLAVEDIIREKSMGAQVHTLGQVDHAQIYEVLAQCHGLVLLSDYEGLPISVLEAMAAGVVPICLDIRSGVREMIEHGVNGIIVKDRAADFLTALRSLQSDSAKWRRLSLAARETAIQRYSIEECAQQWIQLLEDLNRLKGPRIDFQAPLELRLPPFDPSFYIPGVRMPSWQRKLSEYIQFVPPLHQLAKASVAAGHKLKSKVTMRRFSPD